MRIRRQRPISSWLALIAVTGVLCACHDNRRGGLEPPDSDAPEIGSARDAASHAKKLYFAKAHDRVVLQGDELLSLYPDDPELEAWVTLAIARTLDREGALTHVATMQKRHPADPWTLFAKAATEMWSEEKSGDGALEASAVTLESNPDHPDFVWLRAESLRLKGTKEDAIAFLETHGEMLARHVELQNVRAASLFDTALEDPSNGAKRAAAYEAFAQARESDPDNVNAHFEPGWFLLALDRPEEAYPLLRSAADLSDARMVMSNYWYSIVQRTDLSDQEKRAEINQSINHVRDLRGTEPELLVTAANIYGMLNLTDQQRDIETRVLNDYPRSKHAEQILYGRIIWMMQGPGRDDVRLRQALWDFLDRDPIFNRELLHQVQMLLFGLIKEDAAVDVAELHRLVLAMAGSEGTTRILAHGEGAIALADRNAYLDDAKKLAEEGVALLPALVEEKWDGIPSSARPPGEAENFEAIMHDALGRVYYQQGRMEDAERELLDAYELDATRPATLLHLGELYEFTEAFRQAERYYIECASLPMDESHPCANILKSYFTRRVGTDDGFDAFLESHRDELIAASGHRVDEEKIDEARAPPPFTLQTLDGEEVALQDLVGKIVILKFWAVWCAPCRVEMPEYAAFHDRFAEDGDLEILTMSLDLNPDAVRRWLKENGLEFEVLLDNGYARSVDVFGIPRTWFIDSQGRKVYDLVGATEDLENEYVARLEVLRRESH